MAIANLSTEQQILREYADRTAIAGLFASGWALVLLALFCLVIVGGATRLHEFRPVDHRVEADPRRHSAAECRGMGRGIQALPAHSRVSSR